MPGNLAPYLYGHLRVRIIHRSPCRHIPSPEKKYLKTPADRALLTMFIWQMIFRYSRYRTWKWRDLTPGLMIQTADALAFLRRVLSIMLLFRAAALAHNMAEKIHHTSGWALKKAIVRMHFIADSLISSGLHSFMTALRVLIKKPVYLHRPG